MSRHVAATTAGRARAIPRTPVPPVPRRVSGPAAPNRRDTERPGGEPAVRPQDTSRSPRRDQRASRAPHDDRASQDERATRGPRSERVSRTGGGAAAVAPRARIDARALVYADGSAAAAVLAPQPRAMPRQRPRTFTAPSPQRLAYGGVAIASRVAGAAVDVSKSRLMDRLVRSRAWIVVIACGLIGLVGLQVTLLKLNSGIGRAVQTEATLERSNSALRADISSLSDGDRIQQLAEADGMVMPAPNDVTYLRAGNAHDDAVRAVRHISVPDPATAGVAGVAGSTSAPDGATPAGATVPGSAGTATTTGAGGTATSGTTPSTGATPSTSATGAPTSTATGASTSATGTSAPTTAATTDPPTATGAPSATATTDPAAAATAAGAPSGGAAAQQATATTP